MRSRSCYGAKSIHNKNTCVHRENFDTHSSVERVQKTHISRLTISEADNKILEMKCVRRYVSRMRINDEFSLKFISFL